MSQEYGKALQQAKEVSANAYAPYSKVKRGAALVAADGSIFKGANLELASYGGSVCAEMSALAQAVSAGKREFTLLALWPAGFPCGLCRQALSEFGWNLELVSPGDDGSQNVIALSELLPCVFGKEQLGSD